MDDWALLRNYAREGSEAAFAELVKRHVTMVYSVACRQAGGRNDLAEEIAQKTFCLLARKAGALPERGLLVGWLYRTTCNLARETIRTEFRRRLREENAAKMRSLETNSTEDPLWLQAAPLLDKAIEDLPEPERMAIVLRFFQSKPMREVALAFGISEEAARMRVSRAVDKLRLLFKKRGVAVTSLTLASWLAERSNAAVPVGLLALLARIPKQAVGLSATISTLSKILIFMAKMNSRKVALLGLAGLLGLTVGIKSYPRKMRVPAEAGMRLESEPGRSEMRARATAQSAGTPGLSNEALAEALENLKLALTAPWPNSRKVPVDRMVEALKRFGTHQKAAVPLLMAEFSKSKRDRNLNVVSLAIHGLILCGTEASSALPELTKLFLSGEIAFLNDSLRDLFLSVDPRGSTLPVLIDGLNQPGFPSSALLDITISDLIAQNPGSESDYRPTLAKMLVDPNPDTRRHAAFILAALPGDKEPTALPIVVEALNLKSLRDPRAYAPVFIPDQNTTVYHDGERFTDENWRLQALNALRKMGPDAADALPALIETAQLMPETNQIRRFVLETIDAVAPNYRNQAPEIDAQATQANRGRELAERAKQRVAGFDELLEGLRNPDSVSACAEAMTGLHGNDLVTALPALVKALDQFNSYEAAQRIKELQPDLLVEQLKQKRLGGLNEIAAALGELGPKMGSALPYLHSILDEMKTGDPNLITVAEAIQKIDPAQPKMMFHYDDLSEATGALLKRIYDNNKTESQVYRTYITEFQDQNNVGRPQLLKFVEATRADPDLHRVFVSKLLEKNPFLAGDIKE